MDERTMVARLLRAHEPDASAARWYLRAADQVDDIAADAGLPFDTVAGIMAALSPRITWKLNVRRTDELALTGDCGGLSAMKRTAQSILSGTEPSKAIKGPKTSAFYRAISGDPDAAVIDVWMMRALGWPKDSLTLGEYRSCARALTKAARIYGSTVASFQAEVWTAVRGSAA